MSRSYRTPGFSIALAEGSTPEKIQLFKVGTFHHPEYGKFEITPKVLQEMKSNFDSKVRGIDLAVDYRHENEDVAAGWIKGIELDESGMWAVVDWTPKGKQIIKDKEFRYISPEFMLSYKDNESLKDFGPTLMGAALTNRPFIKRMEPVVELAEGTGGERERLHKEAQARSQKYGIEVVEGGALTPGAGDPTSADDFGDPVNYKFPLGDKAQVANARVRFKQFANQTYKEAKSRNIVHERIVRKELALGIKPDFDPKDPLDAGLPSDIKDKLTKPVKATEGGYQMTPEEMMAKIKELEAELAKEKGEKAQLAGEKAKYEEAKKMAEKEAAFAKLLTEGKAVAAQKDSYMAGDMIKFTELAQPLKLTTTGNSGEGQGKADEGKEDVDDKIIKLAEEKVEKKLAKNMGEAISMVLHENADLKKQKYAN